ncbi:3-oxoacyl-[acyl-carrier protein] reductase [Archangium gephyra]|uniref:3-oxoacyl-[acyl-carrier protein] reductase n=1 Tax=Archangium gephyra TaxID=48 RepID=A0AAC8QCD7_9BACT|nr:glucose 1-dehydrogenase [Archangium gephyra]AKJ04844.1 3-oxoacyl-[acyl-carrier protein] reductase [Archangium gephyra]REG37111.1 3-oxoacyl-[acyl-carrier protein] reductase [Archangium gephyra]
MNNGLEGKVAVVTGASRGIGASIARKLAAQGAKVVINYTRNEEAARQVAADIQRAGGEVLIERADVADEAQVKQLFERVDARFGRLDILVNNAGILEFRPLEAIDRAHYQRIMEINLWGVVTASQQAARRLGQGGRIINITSASTRSTFPALGMYAASKGAVEAFARTLATELGPRGITVNNVFAGMVETDMTAGSSPEGVQAFVQATPLRRTGQPEDVADVVAFLASENSRWVTGQSIGATGGVVMS